MPRQVAVVPHTHWDREWYDAFPAFRGRLVEVVGELLDRLEHDLDLSHVLLDGQMALIDDYLAIRPDDEGRIRSLVRTGRLSIGPWYVLMDEFLVSAETIVRNLQRGMVRASSLGGHLAAGYLPDMFGHVAQMPQLLRQAGLAHAVVWRGVPSAINRTAFWWRALDGSTVRAEYLPAGYSNGASIPDDADALVRRLRAHEAELTPFIGSNGTILLMNGTDHQAPPPWLTSVLRAAADDQKDFELEIVALADYLAAAPVVGLPAWTGELRSGARANLLMGVASNRVDVKIAAAVAERSLERRAEPLAALWLDPTDWPTAMLDEAWLDVVRNSAHDSICACSADEVGLAVRHRFAEATAIAEHVTGTALRAVRNSVGHDGTVVVNAEPTSRAGFVEVVVAGTVAPAGAQVLEQYHGGRVERGGLGGDLGRILGELTAAGWLDDGTGTSAEVHWSPDGVDIGILLDPAAAADRSLRPVDSVMAEARTQAAANAHRPLRVTVRRAAAVRVLAYVPEVPGYGWSPLPWEDPDRHPALADGAGGAPGPVRGGDNWLDNGIVHLAVSPADGTFAINGLSGLDRLVDGGDAGDTYNYSPPGTDTVVERPDVVAVRALATGPVSGRLIVERTFTWPERVQGDRRVGGRQATVTTTLELRAGEPLVRVSTTWDNAVRDHRLRATFPLPSRVTSSEAECAFGTVTRSLDAEGGPGEAGLATYPSRRWVRAGDLTLTHEGLLEYEILDGGRTLALTLLRATGLISQPAPALRPNAAGPPTPTPAAQMVGPVTVRYGVVVGSCDPWRVVEAAWAPMDVVPTDGTGPLAPRGSHLVIRGAEVSALHRCGPTLTLRVVNPRPEPTVVEIPGRRGWLVDLTGKPLEAWDGSFILRPWAFATAQIS